MGTGRKVHLAMKTQYSPFECIILTFREQNCLVIIVMKNGLWILLSQCIWAYEKYDVHPLSLWPQDLDFLFDSRSLIAQLVRARHRWGFQAGMWLPVSRVQSQAEATCVNRFHYRVRLTSLSDETLKPTSLVSEIIYRASQRSNGTLINPGIQVGCQRKLTWSYKQSTPHNTLSRFWCWQARRSPSGERYVFIWK